MGDYKEYIRCKIEKLRINNELSEYQLSLELGHSQGYIQSISSGRALPSMQSFLDICDYFEITPLEFFTPSICNPSLLHDVINELNACNDEELLLIKELIKYFHK